MIRDLLTVYFLIIKTQNAIFIVRNECLYSFILCVHDLLDVIETHQHTLLIFSKTHIRQRIRENLGMLGALSEIQDLSVAVLNLPFFCKLKPKKSLVFGRELHEPVAADWQNNFLNARVWN